MTRALDHIVWPARDLERLAEVFRKLGFTVGRRNRHPWGTVNHIIQFDGAFLELLGFADDYCSPHVDDPSVPFAGFCETYLGHADVGAAMLVLRSADANADAARLRTLGLGQGRMLPFSRSAQGPDGSDRTVAFTIAFAALPGLPQIGAFLCEQHRPENFWNAAAQRHANGACGITGLTIQGPEPEAHGGELRRFADDMSDAAGTPIVLADGCQVHLMRCPNGEASAIAAVEIAVDDLPGLAIMARDGGIPFAATATALTVSSPALGDTTLVFRPAGRVAA